MIWIIRLLIIIVASVLLLPLAHYASGFYQLLINGSVIFLFMDYANRKINDEF